MRDTLINRRNLLRSGCATGLLGALPASAFAHRQKKAQTTIKWNAQGSSLEITHMLHRHDAERALVAIGLLETPDLSSLKSRAILALYLSEQFGLQDLDAKPINVDIIGAENSGPHIYAYFEAKLDTAPAGLLIRNRILQEVYADQINHVNVHFGTDIKSAIFARGDQAKKVLA